MMSSFVTIQPEQHMMEPELAEEDTMDIRHDISLGEIRMGTHIEPMMDMRLTLGLAFEEEQSDAQTPSAVTAVVDPYPIEMLEVDGIVLQGARDNRSFTFPMRRMSYWRWWSIHLWADTLMRYR